MKYDDAAAFTHVGRVRHHNEDAHLSEPRLGLVAVADGMGGMEQGEVASATAVLTLRSAMEGLRPIVDLADARPSARNRIELGRALDVVTRLASQRIQDVTGGAHSGTTLLVAQRVRGHVLVAHTGDSRAYLFRRETLFPVTEDHTIAAAQQRAGMISAREALDSPYQHMLYQALGTQSHVDPDLLDIEVADGDLLLLCTDGLYGPVPDPRIRAALAGPDPLEAKARALVNLANEAGGPDNVTVVLARIQGGPSPEEAEAAREAWEASPLLEPLGPSDRLMLNLYADRLDLDGGEHLAPPGPTFLVDGRAIQGARTIEAGGICGIMAFSRPELPEPEIVAESACSFRALSRESWASLETRRPALAVKLLRAMLGELAREAAGAPG